MERRRHGAVLRALASWTWRHIGVEFVIGSYVNAPKLFLQVLCFFSLHKNQHSIYSNLTGNSRRKKPPSGMSIAKFPFINSHLDKQVNSR